MRLLTVLALMMAGHLAHGQDLPREEITVCEGTRTTICFASKNKKTQYTMSDIKNVIIRENYKWVDSELLSGLKAEELNSMAQYEFYMVNYIAFAQDGDESRFLATITYSNSPFVNVIYVQGTYADSDVKLTSFWTPETFERDVRLHVNTVANILVELFDSTKKASQEGLKATNQQDAKSAAPVKSIVKHQLQKQSTKTAQPEIVRP